MAMPTYKKMPSSMRECPGPECGGCSSAGCYAKGGEVAEAMPESAPVEDGEPEMHEELRHAMGGELMGALERKDHKGIMDAMEAIVLSCRGKG